jgi:hypothetical protein
MAIKNFKNFMFAIAVKCRPLDCVRFVGGPIEEGGSVFMGYAKLSTYVS